MGMSLRLLLSIVGTRRKCAPNAIKVVRLIKSVKWNKKMGGKVVVDMGKAKGGLNEMTGDEVREVREVTKWVKLRNNI